MQVSQLLLYIFVWNIQRVILMGSSSSKNFDSRLSHIRETNQNHDRREQGVETAQTIFQKNIAENADLVKHNLNNDHVDWVGDHEDDGQQGDTNKIISEVFWFLFPSAWSADNSAEDTEKRTQRSKYQRNNEGSNDGNDSWRKCISI